ncbi:MAG: YHYH protein [Chloroflexota bacterium]
MRHTYSFPTSYPLKFLLLLLITIGLIGCESPLSGETPSQPPPPGEQVQILQLPTVTPGDNPDGQQPPHNAPDAAQPPEGGDVPAQDNLSQPSQAPPDLALVAESLGISEQQLREALGPPPPDLAAAATTLGISEQALREALDAAGLGSPPDNGGNGAPQPESSPVQTQANDVPLSNQASATTGECPTKHFLDVQAAAGNEAYPAPTLNVTCNETSFTISSNGIPNFEFVRVTPSDLFAKDQQWNIPLTLQVADQPSDIPLIGPVAVAVNGLPIYGPNEAEPTWGDPYLDQILDYCNGHMNQNSYHYHARPDCLFQNMEGNPSLVIGYAFDGYPILAPYICVDADCTSVQKVESSWQRTQNVEAAWDAHSYVEGSGDLDQCNGRTLVDGSYAYFATDTFPYILGCYRGVVSAAGFGPGAGGGGQPPQGGQQQQGNQQQGQGGQPAQGGQQPSGGPPDFAAAAATLGVSEQALMDALGPPPPDFAAAAATLGVSEEALRQALGAP